MNETGEYDVAIVGGGPAGSTCASLLRKYHSSARIVVLEREKFPRDHVGESQLPPIGAILHEMGVWDEVEAAEFPIKIGATYRWGQNPELWDFEFLPLSEFRDEPRPARYQGQRLRTALQVDRARYDEILLAHAAKLGCEVRQETTVESVAAEGDRIAGLRLKGGTEVRARYYVDASGGTGVLRRALRVATECPTRLKNVAFWDYWDNAEWAIEIGVGGTRVQVMSLEYGWLWFIPISPTRASVGLVCPAETLKGSNETPEDLYARAISSESRISSLLERATPRGRVERTKDWSFLAERAAGDNWFLCGEAIGFADPILAAGMTLAHTGARELAHVLSALLKGEHPPDWLKQSYDETQRSRIEQHIRFANFWYASNGQFSDLKEHCRDIAEDAGLTLNADQAWAWLAQGGFTADLSGQAGLGGLDLAGAKQVVQRFSGTPAHWQVSQNNIFTLNLDGATREAEPIFRSGTITRVTAYRRGSRRLVLSGFYNLLFQLLERFSDIGTLVGALQQSLGKKFQGPELGLALQQSLQCLEVMMNEGWVEGRMDATKPHISLSTPDEGSIIHTNHDPR